jgi:hypothetical protein
MGFYYVLYCVLVWNATFTCFFTSFVIPFVYLPLYVKVAYLVSWCCGSVFLLCLCWLGCLVPGFILYSLLCSVFYDV